MIYRFIPQKILNKNMSVAALNVFWFNNVKNFIVGNPTHWFRLIVRKCLAVFHNNSWHDIRNGYYKLPYFRSSTTCSSIRV